MAVPGNCCHGKPPLLTVAMLQGTNQPSTGAVRLKAVCQIV
jgi:hypothetical protein